MNDEKKPLINPESILNNTPADQSFNNEKQAAKTNFNAACNLYRTYVGAAETYEERRRRIHKFRGG